MNQSTDTTRTSNAVKTAQTATENKPISPTEKLITQMQKQNDALINVLIKAGWVRSDDLPDAKAHNDKNHTTATKRSFTTLLVTTASPPTLLAETWLKPINNEASSLALNLRSMRDKIKSGDAVNADAETTRVHLEMVNIARGEIISAAAGARLAALAAKKPMSNYMTKINETIATTYKRDLAAAVMKLRSIELSPPALTSNSTKTAADEARAIEFDSLLKSICDHDEEIGDDSADDLAAVCATWGDDLVIISGDDDVKISAEEENTNDAYVSMTGLIN